MAEHVDAVLNAGHLALFNANFTFLALQIRIQEASSWQ